MAEEIVDHSVEQFMDGNRLRLIVRANSNKTEFTGWDESRKALRMNVAAAPDKEKANKEILRFFARNLKKRVEIVGGAHSKEKLLKIL